MIKEKIELLRDTLNEMIIEGQTSEEELLTVSRELDRLLLQLVKMDCYSKTVLGDGLMKEFEIIVDKLQIFEKIYHAMRIVDPVSKKVLELKESKLCELDISCYDYWNRSSMCENCISMRAYYEDDAIFKMEYNGENIYMLTAVPISIQGRKLVVELLKNITNSLYLGSERQGGEARILSSIEFMNQAVVKDELTNLYNRRYINEKLPVDLLNSSIQNEPLSIIFADLDFFKTVNDKYGHSTGDQVLRDFAEELKKHIRSGKDWGARYGGDEFMICLPNTGIDTAKTISERIRKSIMQKEFIVEDEKIHLTCSFGVHTVCNEKECLTIDGIIELADKKLYQAKNEGKNKVV